MKLTKTTEKIINTFNIFAGAAVHAYGTTGKRTGTVYDVPTVSDRIIKERDRARDCLSYMFIADVIGDAAFDAAREALNREYDTQMNALYRAAEWND